MIQCSKCSFKIPRKILLQIFLQKCSLKGGVILDELFAHFSDTAIVWNIRGTASALTSCFSKPLRSSQTFVPSSWTVILEEAKNY